MGTYSPTPFLSEAQLREVERAILEPWLKGCAAEGIEYRGILYPGLMLTRQGPKVLEFNARFGDPETQVYLPRLKNDLVEVLEASMEGSLDRTTLEWSEGAAVCIVMASGGYPGSYARGKRVEGLDRASLFADTKVFHAGTALSEGSVVTNGGRVLGVTAWRSSLKEACDSAYEAAAAIHFDGAHYRRDIASRALGLQA
jgi:phosphoribosylamine--glycine ligase